MEYKYPEGLEFKIQSLQGVKSIWKFDSDSGSCNCAGYLDVGEIVILKHHYTDCENLKYMLSCSDGKVSDWLSESELETMMGENYINNLSNKLELERVKPPLGVVPKKFYEYDRIQELSRAIHEYTYYYSGKPDLKIDLLIKWTEELLERLYQYKI
jgi:hypothetical protein